MIEQQPISRILGSNSAGVSRRDWLKGVISAAIGTSLGTSALDSALSSALSTNGLNTALERIVDWWFSCSKPIHGYLDYSYEGVSAPTTFQLLCAHLPRLSQHVSDASSSDCRTRIRGQERLAWSAFIASKVSDIPENFLKDITLVHATLEKLMPRQTWSSLADLASEGMKLSTKSFYNVSRTSPAQSLGNGRIVEEDMIPEIIARGFERRPKDAIDGWSLRLGMNDQTQSMVEEAGSLLRVISLLNFAQTRGIAETRSLVASQMNNHPFTLPHIERFLKLTQGETPTSPAPNLKKQIESHRSYWSSMQRLMETCSEINEPRLNRSDLRILAQSLRANISYFLRSRVSAAACGISRDLRCEEFVGNLIRVATASVRAERRRIDNHPNPEPRQQTDSKVKVGQDVPGVLVSLDQMSLEQLLAQLSQRAPISLKLFWAANFEPISSVEPVGAGFIDRAILGPAQERDLLQLTAPLRRALGAEGELDIEIPFCASPTQVLQILCPWLFPHKFSAQPLRDDAGLK